MGRLIPASTCAFLHCSLSQFPFPAEVVGAVEPYLIRSRLAVVTRGGRKLTEKGIEYLGVAV